MPAVPLVDLFDFIVQTMKLKDYNMAQIQYGLIYISECRHSVSQDYYNAF